MYRGEIVILAAIQRRISVHVHLVSVHVDSAFELLLANIALKVVMTTVF